jgi:hypothetical protein
MIEHLIIDGVRIYGQWDRGNLWFMGRATDKDTFDALALGAKLKVYTNPAQAETTDPETGEVVTPAVAASGFLVSAPGLTIAEIGSVVLMPGVYDSGGNETTAPIRDTAHHVNFWLSPVVVARGEWMQWATLWTYSGAAIVPNKVEDGMTMRGFALIDPATTSSPSNRLL